MGKGGGRRDQRSPVVLGDGGPTDGGRPEVLAAGGIVWRPADGGGVEVLLVHRPKYDDWTFPKGKLDPGEADADAARREVEEETGLTCRLGPELPTTVYTDGKGRPKQVRYWAMTVRRGRFAPNAEVDEVRWLAPAPARDLLTYPRDALLLDATVAAGDLA